MKVVGEYQLTEKIGKGNYADVYLGFHKTSGQKYAIKAISKDTFSEPKLLTGLESEIRIMREFQHPNILQLFKYFSSEKNFYLVLEYCTGGDLSKFIRKRTRLSEGLAYNFLLQLAEGLSFLNENNFIHRDLKPANVLLTEASDSAILKIADFGFARHLTGASLAQTRCGTPLYMAPEILEARDYDAKADIWSVGCIFYEMLVGTCPFKGTNEIDLLNNIRTKALKVPSDVEISKVSIDILSKLLERQVSRRASVSQLTTIMRQLASVEKATSSSTSSGSSNGSNASGASNGDNSEQISNQEPASLASASEKLTSSTSAPIPISHAEQNYHNNSGSSLKGMNHGLATATPTSDKSEGVKASKLYANDPNTPSSSASTLSNQYFRNSQHQPPIQQQPRTMQPFEEDFVFIDGQQDSTSHKMFANADSHHEDNSDSLLTHNLITKCEIFGDIVVSITKLADRYVEKEMKDIQQLEVSQSSMRGSRDCVEALTSASVLYLHAMSILKPFLTSFDNTFVGNGPSAFIAQSCRQEMWGIFMRLMQRAEQTESFLDYCLQNNPLIKQSQITISKPETLMLNEAIKSEGDAGLEELLGNLENACTLCKNAKSLIYGVSLTIPEEDRKVVKTTLKMMTEKIESKITSYQAKLQAIF